MKVIVKKYILTIFFLCITSLVVVILSGCTGKPIPGDVQAFDPFKALPQVTEYAGEGFILMGMVASFVKSDGFMDLKTNYNHRKTPEHCPQVQYFFYKPGSVTNNENKNENGHWVYCAINVRKPHWIEWRTITTTGPGAESVSRGGMGYNQGMEKFTRKITPDPDLIKQYALFENHTKTSVSPVSLSEIWAAAVKAGVPGNTVANISYNFWSRRISFKKSYNASIRGYKFDWNGKLIH
ncbi:hypothetical protein ES705_24922 [subsurface metagenome]